MMPVDISVIIPCFNRVGLLMETLLSVEAAIARVTAEIILVDDGSDRPISEQIDAFKHLPLIIIRQENSGLTTARYRGLMAATGNYIQFLDSDDRIMPQKFDVQLAEMRARQADVSHTDIIEYQFDCAQGTATKGNATAVRHCPDAPGFYLTVQPAPHSPIFCRHYLLRFLSAPFIPLSRDYDAIGEVWFYYNLAIYPAKIIKIDEPLAIIVHHDDGRLTDHWELMGLCALTLNYRFIDYLPATAPYCREAKKLVAAGAFKTFRRLPYDMDERFQRAFIDIWQRLGKTGIEALGGGRYFTLAARLAGPLPAAKLFKWLTGRRYKAMRTLPAATFNQRLEATLAEWRNKR